MKGSDDGQKLFYPFEVTASGAEKEGERKRRKGGGKRERKTDAELLPPDG